MFKAVATEKSVTDVESGLGAGVIRIVNKQQVVNPALLTTKSC